MARRWTACCRDTTLPDDEDSWVRVTDDKGNEIFKSQLMSWQEASLLQDVLEEQWEEGFKHGLDRLTEQISGVLEFWKKGMV